MREEGKYVIYGEFTNYSFSYIPKNYQNISLYIKIHNNENKKDRLVHYLNIIWILFIYKIINQNIKYIVRW